MKLKNTKKTESAYKNGGVALSEHPRKNVSERRYF